MSTINFSVLLLQIYHSRKNVLQLMDRQGYDISGYDHFSTNEINAMKTNDQLDMLLLEKSNDNNNNNSSEHVSTKKKMYISYFLGKAIRTNILHEMIQDLFELTQTLTKQDTLYIIANDFPNEKMKKELKEIWERDGIFVVIEGIKALQFNILEHELVPPHEIVTDEDEVRHIMERFNITDKAQFPDISRFDPVARAICLRPGQLCRILRPSKTAIVSEYFRICL